MAEELYRLKETMRLIGKRLDRHMAVPDPSQQINELLRVLSDVPTPAEAEKRKRSKLTEH
jgi:hypothetical protein